jgi:hypothetical protein
MPVLASTVSPEVTQPVQRPPGEIRTDRRLMTVDHRHEGVDVAVQRPVYQLRIEAIALLGSTPRS